MYLYPSDEQKLLLRYQSYLNNVMRVNEKIIYVSHGQYDQLFFTTDEVRIINHWFMNNMTIIEIKEKTGMKNVKIRNVIKSIVYKLEHQRHALYWRENVLIQLEAALMESVLSLPIRSKAINAIMNAKIETMADLSTMTESELDDLYKLGGVGRETIKTIKKEAAQYRINKQKMGAAGL